MKHLSAEDISAWLAGERAADRAEHLDECAECRSALASMERPLAEFRGAVKAWGGRELSAVRPIEMRRRSFGIPRWAMAAAMVVILAGVPLYLRDRARERATETARQDEALLQEVQIDVGRSAPETMEPLAKLVWSGLEATSNK